MVKCLDYQRLPNNIGVFTSIKQISWQQTLSRKVSLETEINSNFLSKRFFHQIISWEKIVLNCIFKFLMLMTIFPQISISFKFKFNMLIFHLSIFCHVLCLPGPSETTFYFFILFHY
jgi:hypothetical protein